MTSGDNINYIPYGRQWIDDDDIRAVTDVLKSDYLTQGPAVDAFESALAEYAGAKYAVVFSSGTAALHAAYFAAGIGAGDEIITSPITFAATANAALYLNAKPVFVDIEPDTGNINVALLEAVINPNTKAVVPVHYAGHPADMEKIYGLAQKHNLIVIEDACHAIGARYRGQKSVGATLSGDPYREVRSQNEKEEKNNWIKIGSCKYSDMTVFSFHPVKHITTGEGGAVLTNNKDYYEKMLMFRTHGITKKDFINEPDGDWYYEMHFLGYNYRMTDIQASLGASQLRKLDNFVERRREIAGVYNKEFKDNDYFDIPVEKDYAFSSYHLYPIRLKDEYKEKKKEIFSMLRKKGLGIQVHYIPVCWHPFYRKMGYERGICSLAEDFYQRELSIPIYPSIKDEELKYVTQSMRGVFTEL